MSRIVFSIGLILFMVISVSAENADVVRVVLRPRSTVDEQLVKTNDIAELQGGSPIVRRLIAELDVIEFSQGKISETISHSQLSLRLQLAGVAQNTYQLSGPEQATVLLQQRVVGDEHVIEIVRDALAEHWQVEPTDLHVRLSQPLPAAVRTLLAEDPNLTVSPFLSQEQTPGSMRLMLGVYDNNNLLKKVTVSLDVQLSRTVAVTTVPLRARQVITNADFRLERRSVAGRAAMDAVMDVANKSTTRVLPAGAILLNKDLRSADHNRSQQTKEIIKRGDIVRLVAHARGLTVAVRACEALENGHIDETIRVRNLRSRKIITGRVINATEIEVSF